MPGAILTESSEVLCAHGAPALPTAPATRVTISGQAVVTTASQHVVASCPSKTPPSSTCVSVTWVTASARVKAMGQPVLLADSEAVASPSGLALDVLPTPSRVVAQ